MHQSKTLLDLWHYMEKPKQVMRSMKLSDGRQESDAEHSWRLALMAIIITPKLSKK